MTARAGMVEIISELRVLSDTIDNLTNEALVDYGVWTDDALQGVLDTTSRKQLTDVALRPVADITGSYLLYEVPVAQSVRLEGDDVCTVVNSNGAVQAGYTLNYDTKLIVFDVDRHGEAYYLRGRGYNMNDAAAEVWLRKANLRSSMVSFKAGDHTVREDQEYAHCMERYMHYKGRRLNTIRMNRNDYAAW